MVQGNRKPGFKVCPECFKIHTDKEWRCKKCAKRPARPVVRTPKRRFLDRIRAAKSRGYISQEEYDRYLEILKSQGRWAAERAYNERERPPRTRGWTAAV